MPDLEELHFGRVYTHLNALLEPVEAILEGRGRLHAALKEISQDAIYRAIATREFGAPVDRGSRVTELRQRLRAIGRLSEAKGKTAELAPFLQTLRWFLGSSPGDPWVETDYFVVPIVAEGGGLKEPGFVYLRAMPILDLTTGARGLSVQDLTQDPELLSATRDYFGTIAAVLVQTLYFVQSFPFDPEEYLTRHAYRLYFGSQIAHGKSMGAAVLATMSMAFLQTVLGEAAASTVNPRRATLLTGEIQSDGSVSAVADIEDKIAAAVAEYGSTLKVILPTKNPLPVEIERKIDAGNVVYVSHAEELLAAVLCQAPDPRGLDRARRALFLKLTAQQKGRLRPLLQQGVETDVYDKIAQGLDAWMTPRSRDGGLYLVSKAWRDNLEIRLGLEPSAVEGDDAESPQKELVQVILDGSAGMDAHWQADPISRLTAVVFQIARRINDRFQDLVCGFLSHDTFYAIDHGELADSIETKLQRARTSGRLRHRGPFFRPVYEASLHAYSDRQKQVLLISDSYVPDWQDHSDLKLSSLTTLRLFPAENGCDGASSAKPLYGDGETMDEALLNRYFSKGKGKIQSLTLGLGRELPIAWKPAGGLLRRDLDHESLVLSWERLDRPRVVPKIRFAHQSPPAVDYRGTVTRPTGAVEFRFSERPLSAALEPFEANTRGELEAAELERWRQICRRNSACPDCDERGVHILHTTDAAVLPQPMFASLRGLEAGWLLLRDSRPDWHHFATGCLAGGIAFAVVDDKLHWSQARGHLNPVPRDGATGLYVLESETGSFYLCPL